MDPGNLFRTMAAASSVVAMAVKKMSSTANDIVAADRHEENGKELNVANR